MKNNYDEKYMKMALELAQKGKGMTSPNPVVGAVIVKDGEIIGTGFHEKYGEPHAERNAINNSKGSLKDATIYVTLEPCCHTGKTPPCTDAIIESGISRVVLGARDPNPKVAGQGIEMLKKNGLQVDEGVTSEECKDINKVFFHYIRTGRPYVTMKYAMTMDGKIAAASGDSKWITGEEAREHVHIERSYNKAIMVGKGTVLKDDPMLNNRTEKGADRNPIRIICDTNLSIPVSSNIVKTAKDIETIIATASDDHKKQKKLTDAGCQIINVNKKDGRIDLKHLMELLGQKGIDSILLEGGAEINWEMMNAGLINKVQTYIAPKLFGGALSKSPIGGAGVSYPKDCLNLGEPQITKLGQDILIESEVIECSQE